MTESMIDHLNIESATILLESDEGRDQIARFGIPEILSQTETDEEREYRMEIVSKIQRIEEEEVHKNQFYSTERGTQTKMFKFHEEGCQTDPPPM